MPGSFLSGLSSGVTDEASRQENYALELKMKSALAEQDVNKHKLMLQNELAEQDKHNFVPPDELNTLTNQLGAFGSAMAKGQQPPAFDFSTIKSPQGQKAALGALGPLMQASGRAGMMGLTPITSEDASGNKQVTFFNRRSGQQLGTTQVGLSGHAATKITDTTQDYNELSGLLDSIESGVRQTITAKSVAGLGPQATTLTINKLMQTNPEANAYLSNIIPHAQRLVKLITGSGRAAENMIKADADALPGIYDTLPNAMAKIDILRRLAAQKMISLQKTYPQLPVNPEFNKYAGGGGNAAQATNADFDPANDPVLKNAMELQGSRSGKK